MSGTIIGEALYFRTVVRYAWPWIRQASVSDGHHRSHVYLVESILIALGTLAFVAVAMKLDGGWPMIANIAANMGASLAVIVGGRA